MIPIKKTPMWTLTQAIEVMKRLEVVLAENGAHCALGGSILYRGTSDKDLDIIIYPHNKNESGWDSETTYKLKIVCRNFFGAKTFNDCKGVSQMQDAKEVSWLTTHDGKRVDMFYLS